MASRSRKLAATAIILGVIVAWLGAFGYFQGRADTAPASAIHGHLTDRGTCLVYIPDSLPTGKKIPLIFALSPGADAGAMIRTWAHVAETHGWIVAASKEFRNGVAWEIVMPQVMAELDAVERDYPVDLNRVAFTGLSGGAMGSHAVAGLHPDRVRAIVLNTGMMLEEFMVADYPRNKLAVFLASPTDFRYGEMHRDRKFLDAHGWTTTWIEFQGGHRLAPPATYEAAAAWLEQHW